MLNIEKFQVIEKIFFKFFGAKIIKLFIILTILAFIATLWNRYIYIDDAFFGEQAYWFAKSGIVKVPSMLSFLGCENNLFSYHKLNIFIGAGLIKCFGWSITPLRTISILFFIALVWMVIKYCREQSTIFSSKHVVIAVFIMVCNPLIVLYAFTFRPEIWVTFFGFASYFFIDRLIRIESTTKYAVLPGIFAGLAFLTHLNGLIFPVAGLIALLSFKKYKALVWYILSGGLISALYFWDLWQPNHIQMWLYQLKSWPNNNLTNYSSNNLSYFIRNIFIKLSTEHQRFYWSYKVWGISSFFFLSFFANIKTLYRSHRLLFIYTISLILSLNIAGSQIAERYLIYFFPFFSIIISLNIVKWMDSSKQALQKALYIIILFLQLGCTIIMFFVIFGYSGNFTRIQSEILSKIPEKEALILAPYEYVFNDKGPEHIASFKGFEYYEVAIRHPLTQDEFFRRADSLGIDYIILPKNLKKFHFATIACFKTLEVEKNPYYFVRYSDYRAIILKSNSQ